jgi:poly(beta-D-mannuronate) lyase
MIVRGLFALLIGFSFAGPLTAKETLVKDVAEFDAAMKTARPGDEIVLADGEWRDAKLVVRGEGIRGIRDLGEANERRFELVDEPITVRAQTPGKVVFVGAGTLRIGGKHLVVRDLLWKECEAESDVIAFRIDSKTLASHCRLENCAILGDRPTKGDRKWVSIYGRENFVIQCRFEGKQSAGTLLVVWLGDPQEVSRHSIWRNFFGPRQKLGKNGGEIIRIGDSKTSMQTSNAMVSANYFYHCDGEAEIISNKSCKNFYIDNVFVGCSGALTLRHGESCIVESNAFFGDGRQGSGGVRIIGEGHQILGNFFHGLEGAGTRAALSLMNGIPDSPLNGYFQVKHVEITGNTFIDCKETFAVGLRDKDQKNQTLPPVDYTFRLNVVLTQGQLIFNLHGLEDRPVGKFNFHHGGELGFDQTPEWMPWKRLDTRPAFDLAKHQYPAATVLEENDERVSKIENRVWDNKMPLLGETGPTWMRPGDEYLPAVLRAQVEKPAEK